MLPDKTMLSFLEESSPLVLTVSELNTQIKLILESAYPFVWVKGEISNFRVPASGHYYFTLKDEESQIRAVFFRPQQRGLKFRPESGLQVFCQGRLSVYEPRGEYQIIVEVMEPEGLGARQLAFEQLKKKLEAEGLFDPANKRPLPSCPQRIAVVTSPTGAAVQDILRIFQRSPYPLTVTLLPVRVQGQEACREIAAAIETANRLRPEFEWDVILLGRGGGSIEDLWPFNEEVVARAVAASRIPVVSAVGHEIDFTIADMVADLRSPTPTAAAEWVVQQLEGFHGYLCGCRDQLLRSMTQRLDFYGQQIHFLERRLTDPKRRLEDLRLLVDDRLYRLQMALVRRLEKCRTLHQHLAEKLCAAHPGKPIQQYRTLVDQHVKTLALHHQKIVDSHRLEWQKSVSRLESLSPLSVLRRGYSVTYRQADRAVVRIVNEVQPGEEVLVQLAEGHLECVVRRSAQDDIFPLSEGYECYGQTKE